MPLIRPRLNDFFDLPFTQEQVDFAIPFIDEDIPLYVDPFLLWKSPSLQDQSLHTTLISSFNHLGRAYLRGRAADSIKTLIEISECTEVGLGEARNKQGRRIGDRTAEDILSLFKKIPQVTAGGFEHVEEIQLFVDQVSRDRVSDIACNILKSFLIDYTIAQCTSHNIPRTEVELPSVFDYRAKLIRSERVSLPVNPSNGHAIILVPKRWLRYVPWINYDDYFNGAYAAVVEEDASAPTERPAVLEYNRENYGLVRAYVERQEKKQADCHNDPLFKPIPVLSAKRKLAEIRALKSGNKDLADKKYEDSAVQLLASLLYPQLDFAEDQVRTDSGVLIRDLIFYNNRSMDFLTDIHHDFGSRQLVMELKNVKAVEREHIFQLNRYLNDQFGRFGVIVTRNPLPSSIYRNTIDLWSGQRRCIIALTDTDLELMVTVFESRQRLPVEVLKQKYVAFMRDTPS
jgi:hypothetical protein